MISDPRAQDILMRIIDVYLQTQLPVGSRTLSKAVPEGWSPATLRNIMADLEEQGFLTSPHRSAGRVPTASALNLYLQDHVNLPAQDTPSHHELAHHFHTTAPADTLENTIQTLAELCQCASILFVLPTDPIIYSIDFLLMSPGKALAVLVTRCGRVEHRLLTVDQTITAIQLQEASNYLNTRIVGYTLKQARHYLNTAIEKQKEHLHHLSVSLMEKGIDWENPKAERIIKGQNHLLDTVQDLEELETFKALFTWLETQETFQNLFDQICHQSQGIQIFIGDEHSIFDVQGCSFIMATYGRETNQIQGGIGVLGPLHMNYPKIIPLMHHAVQALEKNLL
jgi:heat-inducible transcriptional repressor